VANGNRFVDTPRDLPSFDNVPAAEERIRQGQVIDRRNLDSPETIPSNEPGRKAWMSPFTDFTHLDNREYSTSDISLISGELDSGNGYARLKAGAEILEKHRETLKEELRGNKRARRRLDQIVDQLRGAEQGGKVVFAALKRDLEQPPISGAITRVIVDGNERKAMEALSATLDVPADDLDNLSAVNRLRRIAGENTPGMKRLERLFDWALYRTTELLSDLNDTVNDEVPYTEARENFIAFLNDLDDHEPGKGTVRLNPRGEPPGEKLRKSGYGLTIKWTCLKPVIKDGMIIGARVVIQWNPHSSSNGVPVKHP
jgi:hypothetical protein